MSPATPCLDDNLLAGWAEGRLDGERLSLVEEHLLRCDACRRLAADLRQEDAPAAPVLALPASGVRRRTLAWAAVLLVALAAGVEWARRTRAPAKAEDTDERLVAAAAILRRAAPELVGDFAPFDAAARRAVEGDVARGAFTVYEPAEAVRWNRPRLRFARVPGATGYDVTLSDGDGNVLWKGVVLPTAGDSWPAEAPDLPYGRSYVIEVAAVGAPERAVATRAFRLISAEELGRLEAADRRIYQEADEDLHLLLLAHLSARWGLWVNAESCAVGALELHPDDAAARDTLAMIRRRLGWAEGAASR